MPTVTGTIVKPNGDPVVGARIVFVLDGAKRAFLTDDDETVVSRFQTTTDSSGDYSIDVPGNAELIPAGTRWRRHVQHPRPRDPDWANFSDALLVPVTGGPYNEDDILDTAPGVLASPALHLHAADLSVHGGGQSLGLVHITANTSTTGTTAVNVTGGVYTFTVPPSGRFSFEAQARVRCSATGVGALLDLCLADNTTLVSAENVADFNNQAQLARVGLRYPTPLNNHPALNPGDEMTYKLRLRRSSGGGTGTVDVFVEAFGLTVSEAFMEAVDSGTGA